MIVIDRGKWWVSQTWGRSVQNTADIMTASAIQRDPGLGLDVITLLTPAIAFNPRSSSSHIDSVATGARTTRDEKDAINRHAGSSIHMVRSCVCTIDKIKSLLYFVNNIFLKMLIVRKNFFLKIDIIISIDIVIHFETSLHRIVLHASSTAEAIASLTRSPARATMIVIIIIILHVDPMAYSTVSRGRGR